MKMTPIQRRAAVLLGYSYVPQDSEENRKPFWEDLSSDEESPEA